MFLNGINTEGGTTLLTRVENGTQVCGWTNIQLELQKRQKKEVVDGATEMAAANVLPTTFSLRDLFFLPVDSRNSSQNSLSFFKY